MSEDNIEYMDMSEGSYEAITQGVRVSVQPVYLEDESDPEEGRYFWAYQVQIENMSAETLQLKSRSLADYGFTWPDRRGFWRGRGWGTAGH